MSLPKGVQDAVSVFDSACLNGRVVPSENAWTILRAHLLSQDAEIERLQSGLAAANGLLRTIAAYTPPDHECERGCQKETCEACKLAKYLQGAGDEA